MFSFPYQPSEITFSPLTRNKPLRHLTNRGTAPPIGSTRGSVVALEKYPYLATYFRFNFVCLPYLMEPAIITTMQDDILNHLKNTYRPDALILHGSRARSKEREHSDWDFILLYTKPVAIVNGRELFADQNIEYSIHTLPVPDIIDEFGGKLQGAKVLYEQDDLGTNLLKEAADYYEQGVVWSKEKIANHGLWFAGRVNGMKDNIDNPLLFHKYLADLYSRVFNYWYWIIQQQHSQPIYIAVEEVAEKDPQYLELVSILVDSSVNAGAKVEVAEQLHARLFES